MKSNPSKCLVDSHLQRSWLCKQSGNSERGKEREREREREREGERAEDVQVPSVRRGGRHQVKGVEERTPLASVVQKDYIPQKMKTIRNSDPGTSAKSRRWPLCLGHQRPPADVFFQVLCDCEKTPAARTRGGEGGMFKLPKHKEGMYHIYIYMYIHTYIYIYMCVYIYTHTYIHMMK